MIFEHAWLKKVWALSKPLPKFRAKNFDTFEIVFIGMLSRCHFKWNDSNVL